MDIVFCAAIVALFGLTLALIGGCYSLGGPRQ